LRGLREDTTSCADELKISAIDLKPIVPAPFNDHMLRLGRDEVDNDLGLVAVNAQRANQVIRTGHPDEIDQIVRYCIEEHYLRLSVIECDQVRVGRYVIAREWDRRE